MRLQPRRTHAIALSLKVACVASCASLPSASRWPGAGAQHFPGKALLARWCTCRWCCRRWWWAMLLVTFGSQVRWAVPGRAPWYPPRSSGRARRWPARSWFPADGARDPAVDRPSTGALNRPRPPWVPTLAGVRHGDVAPGLAGHRRRWRAGVREGAGRVRATITFVSNTPAKRRPSPPRLRADAGARGESGSGRLHSWRSRSRCWRCWRRNGWWQRSTGGRDDGTRHNNARRGVVGC